MSGWGRIRGRARAGKARRLFLKEEVKRIIEEWNKLKQELKELKEEVRETRRCWGGERRQKGLRRRRREGEGKVRRRIEEDRCGSLEGR